MTENALYEQIARYLNLKHPGIIYHFDLSGVNNASKYTRALYGRLNRRAWPDLFVAHIQLVHENYGLFLELKREGTRLKKRSGEWASDHIAEQAGMMLDLRAEGYSADFAVGFDQAVAKIEAYLQGDDVNKLF